MKEMARRKGAPRGFIGVVAEERME